MKVLVCINDNVNTKIMINCTKCCINVIKLSLLSITCLGAWMSVRTLELIFIDLYSYLNFTLDYILMAVFPMFFVLINVLCNQMNYLNWIISSTVKQIVSLLVKFDFLFPLFQTLYNQSFGIPGFSNNKVLNQQLVNWFAELSTL